MERKKWNNIIAELGEKLEESNHNYAFYLFEDGEDPICGTRLRLEQIAIIFESMVANLGNEEINSLIRYLMVIRDIKNEIEINNLANS
ncbi:MAG: hypothetical protein IJ341_11705 [Bacteroidales bacterium]|nr:hypothetical protein [Bacteroidales bacterium]MBQ7820349.1 hypothetical protein [Bacteroidales bacterium]